MFCFCITLDSVANKKRAEFGVSDLVDLKIDKIRNLKKAFFYLLKRTVIHAPFLCALAEMYEEKNAENLLKSLIYLTTGYEVN